VWRGALVQALERLGYREGQNLALEVRSAEGRLERLSPLAEELIRARVEVIVSVNTPGTKAAIATGTKIPIVMAVVGDPVGNGFVPNLNRPGGTVTGVSVAAGEIAAKRLELLKTASYSRPEVTPSKWGWSLDSICKSRLHSLGKDQELDSAFATLVQSHAAALLVTADPFFDTRRDRIIALAAQFRLPAIYQFRDYAVAGGLVSYGVSVADGYRQVGIYAGRVLKGGKPGDLPIYQAIKFEFVLNLKTARALDLPVPPMLSALADEVIGTAGLAPSSGYLGRRRPAWVRKKC
jgi:putative ABC transport system substrate-binding protein